MTDMKRNNKRNVNIYLVGNTGVGKTHLINCLLNKEQFESRESSTSVTREIETAAVNIDAISVTYYNIPGLLEDDDERIKQNVEVLKEAFADQDDAYIFYILTVESGRLRSNDCDAYKALSKAYQMNNKSFAWIVNKWDSKTVIKEEVSARIKFVLEPRDVYFVPKLTGDFKQDGKAVGGVFEIMFQSLTPHVIKKLQEFSLSNEELKAARATIKKLEKEFKELQESKQAYEEVIKKEKEFNDKVDFAFRLTFGILTLGLSEALRALYKGVTSFYT